MEQYQEKCERLEGQVSQLKDKLESKNNENLQSEVASTQQSNLEK